MMMTHAELTLVIHDLVARMRVERFIGPKDIQRVLNKLKEYYPGQYNEEIALSIVKAHLA